MTDHEHINDLIGLHQSRLRELEKQQAIGGTNTDPEVIIEIEGIRSTIAALQAQQHQSVARAEQCEPKVLVPETQQPQQHRGIIVIVGTGRPDETPLSQATWASIKHHMPKLEVCWLIASGGEQGSIGIAEHYRQECLERKIMAYVWSVGDPFSVQESYNLVERIYTREVPAANLTEDEVIADFTDGVRPMSAGMILACGDRRAMQYMTFAEDGSGSVPLLVRFAREDNQ